MYLSSLPILDCPDYTIRNTNSEIKANKFIELCFRIKDDHILHTTALVVPDYGSVKFLLSISSMNHLNRVIDVSSRQISIRKKSFVFKSYYHNRVKAHDTMTLLIYEQIYYSYLLLHLIMLIVTPDYVYIFLMFNIFFL